MSSNKIIEGDFSFIKDIYIKNMVEELYTIINNLDEAKKDIVWGFFKNFSGESFSFMEIPYQTEILNSCKTGHSGTSWSVTLQHMKLISLDWDSYVSKYKKYE